MISILEIPLVIYLFSNKQDQPSSQAHIEPMLAPCPENDVCWANIEPTLPAHRRYIVEIMTLSQHLINVASVPLILVYDMTVGQSQIKCRRLDVWVLLTYN